MAFSLIVLALTTVWTSPCPELFEALDWDPFYRSAIEDVATESSARVTEAKKLSLTNTGALTNSERQRQITEACSVSNEIMGSVLLEYGSANVQLYGMMWLIETGDEVILLRNDDKPTNLSQSSYDSLWKELENQEVWSLRSDADMRIYDGVAYFLSVYRSGRSHQVAVYSPPQGGASAADRGLRASTDRFSRAIEEIKAACARPAILNAGQGHRPSDE